MSDLVPIATGTLESTPLTHLLVYCLDRELSGTLVLQSPDNLRHAILFQRGVPVKVKTGVTTALLGKMLVELSVVPVPDVEDALVASETLGCPLGQALMEAGKIAPAKLLEVLRLQTSRKLISLFAMPAATAFGFYEKNLLEGWGGAEPAPVDVLATLHAGINTSSDPARIKAALAALGDKPLKPHPQGDFKRFALSDRGRSVLDLLRVRPMPLAQLLGSGAASEAVIERVIYTFLLTRHLDLGQSNKPPLGFVPSDLSSFNSESGRAAVGRLKLRNIQKGGGVVEVNPARNQTAPLPSVLGELGLAPGSTSTPPSAPAAADAMTPELEARRKEITERAETIEREDFFTMLGVAQDAPSAAVQAAYFGLAKRWHPDKLPPPLASLRDQAAKVFSRLSEASQTLMDGEKRARYVELMKQGGGTPEEQEKVNKILEAQIEYQKAEILMKKGDLAEAERFAAKAADKDPEQPDYLALLAWIRSTKPGAFPDDIATGVKTLDSVLAMAPNHQQALWYRGSLLKRLGKDSTAVVDFRKLLELDPRSVNAAREIRLFEMRAGTKKDEPKKDDDKKGAEKKGLFGGLFSKK